jgi:hypothetical protein
MRGLGVDDWQLDLQVVKVGANVWHVHTEGVFVRAVVVQLR